MQELTSETRYDAFRNFHEVIQDMEMWASANACFFGTGARSVAFLDAMLFYNPYFYGMVWMTQRLPDVAANLKSLVE
eukprot:1947510-Amphidinium_carterae.1